MTQDIQVLLISFWSDLRSSDIANAVTLVVIFIVYPTITISGGFKVCKNLEKRESLFLELDNLCTCYIYKNKKLTTILITNHNC